jgi:CheY-like chemotaxis protein
MLSMHRMLPKVVVLDAALPKMFGFQVCEVVKRNESLRHIKVVLIGAIHHQDRYRRDPADLYGADVYLEQPDLPDGLRPLLLEEGLPCSDGEEPVSSEAGVVPTATDLALDSPKGPESMPEPEPEPTPISEPPSAASEPDPVASAAPSGVEDPEITAERERAERLARIAVSEMLLYQPEKFDAAIRDQNLEEVLDLEIQEARALIRQRISEEVRSEKDFILEELERVAKERSGQA